MFFSAWSKTAKIVGATSALAITAVPVAVLADASNPVFTPKKKVKAKAKPRRAIAKARSVAAKPVAKPAPVAVAAPAPVYTPPPVPVYTPPPAPVYTPPPVVVPAAPAAPVAAAKGGNGLLLGALGAAAAIAGVVLATSKDKPASP
jgi:hypothetical protein